MPIGSLRRLLAPRRVALIGGVWADAVARASEVIGFDGELWRVHPTRPSSTAVHYYRSVEELPGAPDAAFVAAPAREVPAIAAALAHHNAGGFVCFAAGFSELASAEGDALTAQLLAAAGELPFFGPNCYGFINFFERAALWPDQVMGRPCERGVALICQSGTIALDLMFNQRSLPLGYVVTVGNQTRVALEDVIEQLCEDPRVTAFGLYIEGIKDIVRFGQAIERCHGAGKPVAVIKAGRTEAAARTARSHTGALAGADVAFDAFCRQAGIARCDTLATLCETLKLLHCGGPLSGRRVLIMGASGGDMAMTADVARNLKLEFDAIPAASADRLREIAGHGVWIANPFDFHTHLWFDRGGLRRLFREAQQAGFDAVGFMVDSPPAEQADPASYIAAIEEFLAADPQSTARRAVISSLPESMSTPIREACLAAGVVPLQGQREALEALDLAGAIGQGSRVQAVRLLRPHARLGHEHSLLLAEYEAKRAVAAFGVTVPRSLTVPVREAVGAAESLGYPLAIKATGRTLQHKSELGGVILDVRDADAVRAAARHLSVLSDTLLIEQMVADAVAEVLIGVISDSQFGQLLLLGAGGTLTELWRDTVALLPPFTAATIGAALAGLKCYRLLQGFRGRPRADVPALVELALGCARYAEAHLERLIELDLNPVIVRPEGRGAVAVDALIRLAKEN